MHSAAFNVAPDSEAPKGGNDITLGRCQAWVDLYDAMHRGVLSYGDDRKLYLSLAQELMHSRNLPGDIDRDDFPVLELGVGTGRVAAYLAGQGVGVTGIDLSTAMLEKAKERRSHLPSEAARRLTLQRGDMKDFDLEGRGKFALAIIPFTAFQVLLAVEDQVSALRCIHRHLCHGGQLAIDIFDPRLERCAPGVVARSKVWEGPHLVTGRIWRVFVDARTNIPEEQLLHEDWRFVEIGADGVVTSQYYGSLTLRWTYRFEMEHLLQRCGFNIMNLWGDCERGPFAYGKRQVWLVRKV